MRRRRNILIPFDSISEETDQLVLGSSWKLKKIFRVIREQPGRYPWFDPPFREAGLLHYPYSVIYLVEPAGNVLVIAVAHASREPGYWRKRADYTGE